MTPKNILITGASGLIGTRLTEMLLQQHHRVTHLSHSHRSGSVKTFTWDADKKEFDREALAGTDTIIHLAGTGIADKPWTPARKQEILESRTKTTQLLHDVLKEGNHQVTSLISASAIGYYGFDDNNATFTEVSPPGKDFLATVVKQWEEEIDRIATLGIRVVKIRIGIVLSEKGGVLKEVMKPVKFYVGAPLGSGNQYLSWIHLDDLCAMFAKAAEDDNLVGAFNGTGPYPVTNRELTKSIAHALQKPLLLPPIPGIVLKLLLGEMADLVLKGSQVSSDKIQATGFRFRFNTLEDALNDLIPK